MNRFISLIIFMACNLAIFSQDFLGLRQSNYAGIDGVGLNPAMIVDSRYKLDVSFIGADVSFYNNYIALKGSAFGVNGAFKDSLFQDKYLLERFNDYDKQVFLNSEIHMPSFLFTLSEVSAIGFDWKIRTMANVDGVSPQLAKLLYEDINYPQYWNNYNNARLSVQGMSWAEYGVVYGRVLRDKDEHFIKAGIKVKLLQGIAAAYTFIDDFHYEFSNDSILSIYNTSVSYGHSDNFEFSNNLAKYKFTSHPGVGFDFGAVYEWRPDWKNYQYKMDGRDNIWMAEKTKYKVRVSLAVTDVGVVKFNKGANSYNYVADTLFYDFRKDHISSVSGFDSLIVNSFNKEQDKGIFKMNLPTAITLNADYHLWKDFYVNGMAFMAFQFKKNKDKVHYYSNYSITPRYDFKWFGGSIPLSLNKTTGFRAGLALRIGPVWLGTSDLKLLFHAGKLYGGDFFFTTKIPIFNKRPRDKDGDKVSNRFDECDVPGTWEFRGCPDSDGDHIKDLEDECPMEAGVLEFHGCPDTDLDGIMDKNDSCPTMAGPTKMDGCPDTDQDGIRDLDDHCPTIAGLLEFNGCPDTDGDGLQDTKDNCPLEAGPVSNYGCPEGIRLYLVDEYGDIIQTAELNDKKQFIFKDLPKDKNYLFLLDGSDPAIEQQIEVILRNGNIDTKIVAMLNKIGYFEYNYLPKDYSKLDTIGNKDIAVALMPEEEVIINTAFENLEFETGKAIISEKSYISLKELAELLKKKPEWTLLLKGYTDSIGTASSNLMLSKRRADAVKLFIVEKGIDKEVIQVQFFGESNPIVSNDTADGRQKNRRVEMTVIKGD